MHQPRQQRKELGALPARGSGEDARQEPRGSAVGVGLVGAGRWGENLARALGKTPRARLEVVCDVDKAKLENVANRYAIRTTSDYSSVLGDKAVQAVLIATPPSTHFELSLEALRADKDVFVEKPMASSSIQARQLCDAVTESGRLLMVGHVLRYHRAVELIERWIVTHELGRVESLFASRFGTATGFDPMDAWWALAPHDISIGRMIFGRDPAGVAASVDNYTVAPVRRVEAVFDYGEGARGLLRISGEKAPKVRRLIIVTSHYLVVFDDIAAPGMLAVHPAPVLKPTTFDEAERAIDERNAFHVPVKGDREPLVVETGRFIDAILDDERIPTDVAEGCAVVNALEAAEESIRNAGVMVSLASYDSAEVRSAPCRSRPSAASR